MALVALRQGQGNSDLAGELLKTVFVTFYLADPDHLATYAGHFTQAETTIKALIKDAALEGSWRLEEDQCEGIERSWACMMRNWRRCRYIGLRAPSSG